jgi:hypothetical protein
MKYYLITSKIPTKTGHVETMVSISVNAPMFSKKSFQSFVKKTILEEHKDLVFTGDAVIIFMKELSYKEFKSFNL